MTERNSRCRIKRDIVYKGYDTLVMENEKFRMTLLPGKGTDVVELLHKPTDTDFCWFTRSGLRRREPLFSGFQHQYEGGWQEILPYIEGGSTAESAAMAYGEVSLVQWEYEVVKDDPEEIRVRFANRLRTVPLRLEKTVILRTGDAGFRVEEKLVNESPCAVDYRWGHHITFGEPFLQPGTLIDLPSRDQPFSVPEPGSPGGFEVLKAARPAYRLMRPDGIGAQVEWAGERWPYLWFWRDFGGEKEPPYFGMHYNVGLELFSSPPENGAGDSFPTKIMPYETLDSFLDFKVLWDAH
ncbi:hypothetical protein [Cohnella nanjingensis]|uniref:DUF4432 family protein n=1 Tax=Cohnella nanjingensis TaxID=1387779 RepID=A0A7X0VEX1_9BACL|nr:hypothetical protein [Cohnella nanjingensis]MBB6670673.1 hypothetical protein [Cohnella nanjingensis]